MTKMAMNPRNFKASSGLSRLRYHLSPHTFFVVVVFIVSFLFSLVVLVVSYSILGDSCFLKKKKACRFVFFCFLT